MFVQSDENYVEIHNAPGINLDITLDCGQAFRWSRNADGSWTGVVRGIQTTVTRRGSDLVFKGISDEEFSDVFYDYFDFGRDYDSVLNTLKQDEHLNEAIARYGVIRILNQEPWETLCSFIISACNNIPRIKEIVNRFCFEFGDTAGTSHAFPSAERTASLTIEALRNLKVGFRAPYMLDAAIKVASGETDFESLHHVTVADGEKELMQIRGVGKKVADCTLLFGLGHAEAFPVDRHIKRICDNLYPAGLPECFNGIEGIAQQYMFHFQRIEGS